MDNVNAIYPRSLRKLIIIWPETFFIIILGALSELDSKSKINNF
jgi:hypothetical protein